MKKGYTHKCGKCGHTTHHRSKRNAARCSSCGHHKGAAVRGPRRASRKTTRRGR